MKIAVNNRKKISPSFAVFSFRTRSRRVNFYSVWIFGSLSLFFRFGFFYLAVSNDNNNNNVTILSLGYSFACDSCSHDSWCRMHRVPVISLLWRLVMNSHGFGIYSCNSHHHCVPSTHLSWSHVSLFFFFWFLCVQLIFTHNIAWILYGRGYIASKQCILSAHQRQLPFVCCCCCHCSTASAATILVYHFEHHAMYAFCAHQIWLPQSFVYIVVNEVRPHPHICCLFVFLFLRFILIDCVFVCYGQRWVPAIDIAACWWRCYFGSCNFFMRILYLHFICQFFSASSSSSLPVHCFILLSERCGGSFLHSVIHIQSYRCRLAGLGSLCEQPFIA